MQLIGVEKTEKPIVSFRKFPNPFLFVWEIDAVLGAYRYHDEAARSHDVRLGSHGNDARQLSSTHGGENPRGTRPMGIWVSVDIWSARASPRQKKALQKRRQKLGVSAGDISGLKLSRRSKHVLPAWSCAPCLTDWMVGWLAGRSVGLSVDWLVRVWHCVQQGCWH